VGSSVEQIKVAYAIQELLEFDGEVTVWTEGTFRPSSYSLDDLLAAVETHDIAVFVFAPDDMLVMRQKKVSAVRDNLLVEFGLFVGARGRDRAFFVMPRVTEPIHLPSDLSGLGPLTYAPNRSDDNLLAALGPACNRIRRAIGAKAGTRRPLLSAADYINAWEAGDVADAVDTLRDFDPYTTDRAPLRRLFSFLESLADSILSGRIDENDLRPAFAKVVCNLWPHLFLALAPLNQADEWWDPQPKLAELYRRWSVSDGK
jgi:hypothetical protein